MSKCSEQPTLQDGKYRIESCHQAAVKHLSVLSLRQRRTTDEVSEFVVVFVFAHHFIGEDPS